MHGNISPAMYTGSMVGAGAMAFAIMPYAIANGRPDEQCTVDLNPAVLSAVFGEPAEKIKAAIDYLCKPDKDSRSPDEEGRRLVQCGPGPFRYRIVNLEKYRNDASRDDRTEYWKQHKKWARAGRKGIFKFIPVPPSTMSTLSTVPSTIPSTMSTDVHTVHSAVHCPHVPSTAVHLADAVADAVAVAVAGTDAGTVHTLSSSPKSIGNGRAQVPNPESASVSVFEEKQRVVIEARMEWLKSELCAFYGRPEARVGYADQCLIAEICRRTEVKSEFSQLSEYRYQLPPDKKHFFPQSMARLLEKWEEILDRSRSHVATHSKKTLAQKLDDQEDARVNKLITDINEGRL